MKKKRFVTFSLFTCNEGILGNTVKVNFESTFASFIYK